MNNKFENTKETLSSFFKTSISATLSTHSKSNPGYPFGSIATYDLTASGEFVIFISKLAEHYKNLEANPHASLLITDNRGTLDPLPFARATALGKFNKIEKNNCKELAASYFSKFPNASSRQIAHDFDFFIMTPTRIRWVGGFGDIRWINQKDYREIFQ
jgi:heme iron utilization protein